jgi:hypothetical protein
MAVVWEEVQFCSQSRQSCERRSKANTEVLRGKKSHFWLIFGGFFFFGDFVTSFASSRLASVTRDIRRSGGLWRVTRELN